MPEEVVTPTTTQTQQAEIQQAIDQLAKDAALADPTKPIEVKLKTGQVYKGIPSEVIQTLSRSQEEASETIKRERDDKARLQAELDQLRQAQTDKAAPPDDQYNAEKYYELFQKDAREAQKYLDRFDEEKQQLQKTMQAMRHRSELQTFQDRVSFYPTNQEKAAFAAEFVQSQLEPNAANYELVFWRMRAENKLTAQPITGLDGPAPPPPPMRGSGSGGPQAFDMEQFEKLPPAQMAEVIDSLRQKGWK